MIKRNSNIGRYHVLTGKELQGMNYDIVALGDLITNYVHIGVDGDGISIYKRYPAGTTSNMLSQAAALGANVGLISTIGDDLDGKFVYQAAVKCGIDVSNLIIKDNLFTRAVFVYFNGENDRYFSYNGQPRTHFELKPDDIDMGVVQRTKIFGFPINALATNKPINQTLKELLKLAYDNGVYLAVDANYRGQYIPPGELKAMREGIYMANIVKMTREEMAYYIEEPDIFKGTEKLINNNADMVAITLDRYGCFLRNKYNWIYMPTYHVVVTDTTGAGDSFMGALLYCITRDEMHLSGLDKQKLAYIADFCNACASVSTTKQGSMTVMTKPDEVKRMMNHGKLSDNIYFAFYN